MKAFTGTRLTRITFFVLMLLALLTKAERLLQENQSVSGIAKTFNVHKTTIYRLQKAQE